MTFLFNPGMQKEKIAAIGLAIIIIGALSAYLLVTYQDEIFENLFGEEKVVFNGPLQLGDSADVNYIGRFTNGTVFDTNIEDVAKEAGIFYETLK